VGLTADGQTRRERPGERTSATTATSPAAATATATAAAGNWRPGDTVYAGRRCERLWRWAPERRRIRNAPASSSAPAAETAAGSALRRGAGERGDHVAGRVNDFDRHRARCVGLEVVVDRGTECRVLRLRLVFLKRRAVVAALRLVDDVRRLEQMC